MFDGVGMESEGNSWTGLFIPTMVCDDGIWGLEWGREEGRSWGETESNLQKHDRAVKMHDIKIQLISYTM